jgi:hypothetical protein
MPWLEALLTVIGLAAAAAVIVYVRPFGGGAVSPPRTAGKPVRPDRDVAQYRASGAVPPWRE